MYFINDLKAMQQKIRDSEMNMLRQLHKGKSLENKNLPVKKKEVFCANTEVSCLPALRLTRRETKLASS